MSFHVRRAGLWDPLKVAEQKGYLLRRLNAHTVHEGDCWRWVGLRNKGGYGSIKVGGRNKQVLVHRLSASIHFGFDLSSPLCILHKSICRFRSCWNPEHIMDGTQQQNISMIKFRT